MKKMTNKILIPILLLLFLFPISASADDWFESERGYYTLLDENEKELTVMGWEVSLKDEYVSSDNKHYIVTRVDKEKKTAYTRLLGEVTLPAVETDPESREAVQQNKGNILLYCTHNDESYVPTDGKESIKGNGGIFDVAEAFQANLRKKGIDAIMSRDRHDPHDAGSYRRSRRTAVNLMKKNVPVRAVFDIHRDAVPKSHYAAKVDGQDMTAIRIVVGRRNQNRKANEELAYKLKAVSDKNYPGLLKDIYFGKGSYNQELTPRSLLFEVGTYESSKELAERSTAYLADIVSKSMYGGTVQKHSPKTGRPEGKKTKVTPINHESGRSGGGHGFLWMIGIVAVGIVAFLFISTGSRERFSRIRRSNRQDYSSFLGRKKKK